MEMQPVREEALSGAGAQKAFDGRSARIFVRSWFAQEICERSARTFCAMAVSTRDLMSAQLRFLCEVNSALGHQAKST